MRQIILLSIILVSVLLVVGCRRPGDELGNNDTGLGDADDYSGEPTKGSSLVEFCLGAQMPRYMAMCSAIANKDPEMCSNIIEEKDAEQRYQRANCIKLVAVAASDSTICDRYETVVSEGGTFIDTGCRKAVAASSLDIKECEKLDDENERNGCIYDVNFMAGNTKVSECIESDCIFNYAWVNKDEEACDYMTEVSTASPMSASFKVACHAMLSGNDKECDPVKSAGVNEWYYCISKALYKKVMPSPGIFNLDLCTDNTLCYKFALAEMANHMARQ